MADTAFLSKENKMLAPRVINVNTPNKAYSDGAFEFNLDAEIGRVLKVGIVCDIPVQGFYRGKFGLKIGDVEVLPEKFEARCLMVGEDCPPEQRYMTIDREKGSGQVKLVYTDADHSEAPFVPYNISVYLLCEYENKS